MVDRIRSKLSLLFSQDLYKFVSLLVDFGLLPLENTYANSSYYIYFVQVRTAKFFMFLFSLI